MRGLLFSLLFGLISMPLFSFANIKSNIGQLETQYKVADTDMYTMIYVRELSEALTDTCSPEDMTYAQQYTADITALLATKYASWGQATVLKHSREMYEKLASIQPSLHTFSEKSYCILKYILYQVQQYLRDAHLEILETTDIIKDFEGFDTSTLYGWTTKRAYMDILIEDLAVYKEKLGTTFSFTTKNDSFKDDLSSNQVQLLNRSQDIMEGIVYKVLYDLLEANLFDAGDISLLKDKVIFEYVAACGIVNGKYEIKETLTSKGEHVSFATEALHLRVNLCPNFFVIRDFPEIYEKIVTHELGHHFYYYHGYPDNHIFEDVCRDGFDDKKASCDADDFVSDYAMSLSVEDYAEHFMHWFLDILPSSSSSTMHDKTAYFDSL